MSPAEARVAGSARGGPTLQSTYPTATLRLPYRGPTLQLPCSRPARPSRSRYRAGLPYTYPTVVPPDRPVANGPAYPTPTLQPLPPT